MMPVNVEVADGVSVHPMSWNEVCYGDDERVNMTWSINTCVVQPPAEMAQPPPPSIPMMFNPAQFNQGAEQPPAPTSSVSQPHGPRYGQRRHYPK